MSTVMSTISEATGLKPDDDVIALAAVSACKAKAKSYLRASMECTSPGLRHIFNTHLHATMTEHEVLSALAIKRGWYKATASAEELVQQAVTYAEPVIQ